MNSWDWDTYIETLLDSLQQIFQTTATCFLLNFVLTRQNILSSVFAVKVLGKFFCKKATIFEKKKNYFQKTWKRPRSIINLIKKSEISLRGFDLSSYPNFEPRSRTKNPFNWLFFFTQTFFPHSFTHTLHHFYFGRFSVVAII